jgi:hypothetical protein
MTSETPTDKKIPPTKNYTVPLTITLGVIFFIDLMIIGGILIHGKANFAEVFKNLK